MSELKMIRLSPKQWQRYREIRLEALYAEPTAFGSGYAEMEQRSPAYWQERLTEAARGEKSCLLFAQQGERLIGMIGAFYNQPQHTADIISVYVNKAERGKGVGKLLMEAILTEIGKKKGIRKAALGVNQEQTVAVGLYRRYGFVVAYQNEEVQGDGKIHRGYWMEKELREK